MLKLVLTWWLQQLRSLLPERWHGGVRLADGLVVDCGVLNGLASGADLRYRRRGRERAAGRIALGGSAPAMSAPAMSAARQILRVAGSPLRRELVLPAAAEADIATILANDMGRLAPFDPAEIFWNWRILHRDHARKRLTIQLWYVPRKTLQPLLTWLSTVQLHPAEAEIAESGGAVFTLALRPASRRRHLGSGVLAGAGLVLAGAVATPFALQSRTQAALERQVAAIRPQAQRVEQLRQRIAPRDPGPAARAAEARRTGDMLEVLAAVTNAFPDDTVLTDIALRERKLSLTGTSTEAALLIAALAGYPTIRDPAFGGPIVRDAATTRDSFSLHATLAP